MEEYYQMATICILMNAYSHMMSPFKLICSNILQRVTPPINLTKITSAQPAGFLQLIVQSYSPHLEDSIGS